MECRFVFESLRLYLVLMDLSKNLVTRGGGLICSHVRLLTYRLFRGPLRLLRSGPWCETVGDEVLYEKRRKTQGLESTVLVAMDKSVDSFMNPVGTEE